MSTVHTTTRVRNVGMQPSPANVVTGGVGAMLLVLGVVALLRTGIPSDTLTSPTVTVGWLTHTPMLALLHVLFGVALISSAFAELTTRPFLSAASVLGLTGIIFTIETGALRGPLALTQAHGVTYVVAAVLMALGVATTRGIANRR